jgi:hypothetical protein
MKAVLVAVILSMLLVGCGQERTINGKLYPTYGVFNSDDNKDPEIRYQVIVGNLIWSVLLCETIVVPIYFFGFSLFEPVGLK